MAYKSSLVTENDMNKFMKQNRKRQPVLVPSPCYLSVISHVSISIVAKGSRGAYINAVFTRSDSMH